MLKSLVSRTLSLTVYSLLDHCQFACCQIAMVCVIALACGYVFAVVLCVTSGDLEKVIPAGDDRFIRDRQIASGFAGSMYALDGVENKIYPAWKGYAQEANAASEDATKLTTGG